MLEGVFLCIFRRIAQWESACFGSRGSWAVWPKGPLDPTAPNHRGVSREVEATRLQIWCSRAMQPERLLGPAPSDIGKWSNGRAAHC